MLAGEALLLPVCGARRSAAAIAAAAAQGARCRRETTSETGGVRAGPGVRGWAWGGNEGGAGG